MVKHVTEIDEVQELSNPRSVEAVTREAGRQREFWDAIAPRKRRWRERNKTYYRSLQELFGYLVPRDSRVLEIGCATGELLADLQPSQGVGVDISPEMIRLAAEKYPDLKFVVGDAHALPLEEKFDYVVLSDLVGIVHDVQQCFMELHKVSTPSTRVIITHYSKLWSPVVKLAETLGVKTPSGEQSWLTVEDLDNLLRLAGFEVVRSGRRLLLPFYIPLVSWFANKFLANLPIVNKLGLVQYVVAKRSMREWSLRDRYTVSVVIPTLNEVGNIAAAVRDTPELGHHTELIFVDGKSSDGTVEKIREEMARQPERDIKFAFQQGKGKASAIYTGFSMARGDILMILDSDLTVPPEDLRKFYDALASGAGEIINGSRLVYPMEKQAMRHLNYLANHFFRLVFTWLLGQPIKDTLCGTKVLFKADYEKIARNRHFFGNFDPFGDFDLLFGASKLNLKIVDVPVRYRERTYGDVKIHRFRHGLILLRMCAFAARKMKFI